MITFQDVAVVLLLFTIGFFASLVVYQRYEKKRRRG